MSALKDFGDTAKGLARNPLGIIALFSVLVYGILALVLGLRVNGLAPEERAPLVWFLVLFPVVVLAVFAWLVVQHYRKLYSPQDFRDEKHFLDSVRPELSGLAKARTHPVAPESSAAAEEDNDGGLATPGGRSRHRDGIYRDNRGLFLAHVLAPSDEGGTGVRHLHLLDSAQERRPLRRGEGRVLPRELLGQRDHRGFPVRSNARHSHVSLRTIPVHLCGLVQ